MIFNRYLIDIHDHCIPMRCHSRLLQLRDAEVHHPQWFVGSRRLEAQLCPTDSTVAHGRGAGAGAGVHHATVEFCLRNDGWLMVDGLLKLALPALGEYIYMGTSQNTRYGSRPRTHTRSIPPDPYLDPYPVVLHDPYPWSIPLIHNPFSLKKDWCWP